MKFVIVSHALFVLAFLLLSSMVLRMDLEVIPEYVCKVQVVDQSFTDTSTGSFLSDSTVVTCAHGLRDYREGRNELVVDGQPATVLYINHDSDVCVLSVSGPYRGPYPKVSLLDSGLISSMGFAKGTTWVESNGYKGAEALGGYKAFSTCKTIQGMSGGPVLNSKGGLVGIVFGSQADGGVYTMSTAILAALLEVEGVGLGD